MNAITTALNSLSQILPAISPLADRLGLTLLHTLWQGLAIALLLILALWLLRRAAPQARYVAACIAMIFFLAAAITTFLTISPHVQIAAIPENPKAIEHSLPPSNFAREIPAPISDKQPIIQSEIPSPGQVEIQTPSPAPASPPRSFASAVTPWLPTIALVWAVGILLLTTYRIGGWLFINRLISRASPSPNAAMEILNSLRHTMNVLTPVRLLQSVRVNCPCTVGWLRPAILVPLSILTELPPDQLQAILAHELAHIRRHDYLVNLLQTAIETLLFYHPATWWISRQIRNERENCCDDIAAKTSESPVVYARALAKLEEMRIGTFPALGANGGRLLSRIGRILGRGESPRPTMGTLLAFILALILMACSLVSHLHRLQAAVALASTQPDVRADATAKVEQYRPTKEDQDLLQRRIGNINFNNVSFFEVFNELLPGGVSETSVGSPDFQQAGNFQPTRKITVALANPTLAEALDAVLAQAAGKKYSYVVVKGAVRIGSLDELAVETEMYDVHDLCRSRLSAGLSSQAVMEQLVKNIVAEVDPDSWSGVDPIRSQDGTIIIQQFHQNQEHIARLFDMLRTVHAAQIRVHASFVLVDPKAADLIASLDRIPKTEPLWKDDENAIQISQADANAWLKATQQTQGAVIRRADIDLPNGDHGYSEMGSDFSYIAGIQKPASGETEFKPIKGTFFNGCLFDVPGVWASADRNYATIDFQGQWSRMEWEKIILDASDARLNYEQPLASMSEVTERVVVPVDSAIVVPMPAPMAVWVKDENGKSTTLPAGPETASDIAPQPKIYLLISVSINSTEPATQPQKAPPATKPATQPASLLTPTDDSLAQQARGTVQAGVATISISGRVIDDQTGEPVDPGWIEWASPEFNKFVWNRSDSFGKQHWAGSGMSVEPYAGRFIVSNNPDKGKKMVVRVVAAGYLPQLVTTEPITAPAAVTNLVIRMKRGNTLTGTVLNHDGKPAAGAKIFLTRDEAVHITDDQYESEPAGVTDKDGHFAITGAGSKDVKLVISAPDYYAWQTIISDPAKEIAINLPQPASLQIHYDIPGGPQEALFRIQMLQSDTSDLWKTIEIVRIPKVVNGTTAMIAGLPPGKYDLVRDKPLSVGDGVPSGGFVDRRTIVLESAKQTETSFVRKTGAPVTGQVLGLQVAKMPGAFIYIRSADATGEFESRKEAMLPYYDALTCGPDGAFKTESLVPGTYAIIVEAYGPEPEHFEMINGVRVSVWYSGIRLPDFIGLAKVTVPETGVPSPVQITLKPGPTELSGPTTQPSAPATMPSGAAPLAPATKPVTAIPIAPAVTSAVILPATQPDANISVDDSLAAQARAVLSQSPAAVAISGRVIDDQTGQPVDSGWLEWSQPSLDIPAKYHWAQTPVKFGEPQWARFDQSGKSYAGRFWSAVVRPDGEKMSARIIADGYLPELITPNPISPPALLTNLVIRLKRGSTIHGIVLDHDSNPAVGAKIFIARDEPIYPEKQPRGAITEPSGLTDQNGHFSISGAPSKDVQITISTPEYYAFQTTIADASQQAVIYLPKPPPTDFVLRVRTPDGQPAAGAVVTVVSESTQLDEAGHIFARTFPDGPPEFTTGDNGEVRINVPKRPYLLAITHDSGYIEVKQADLVSSKPIQLKKWGRIEGTVQIGTTPQPADQVDYLTTDELPGEEFQSPQTEHNSSTKSDANGHFVFDRVPAGAFELFRDSGYAQAYAGTVAAGQTANIDVGGTGRPIVGTMPLPSVLTSSNDWYNIRGKLLKTSYRPGEAPGIDHSDYNVSFNDDGSFRVEDVGPGTYKLSVTIENRNTLMLARGTLEFSVPKIPGGRSDEPLQLPLVKLILNPPPATEPVLKAMQTRRAGELEGINNPRGNIPSTQPAPATQPATQIPKTESPAKSSPLTLSLAESPTTEPVAATTSLEVLCVDTDGKPVPAAQVYLLQALYNGKSGDPKHESILTGPLTTDAAGSVTFKDVATIQNYRSIVRRVYARVPGKLVGMFSQFEDKIPNQFDSSSTTLNVIMYPAAIVQGIARVPAGQSITNVKIHTAMLSSPNPEPPIAARPPNSDMHAVLISPATMKLAPTPAFERSADFSTYTFLSEVYDVTPKADGTFAIADVPANGMLDLIASGPGMAQQRLLVDANDPTSPDFTMAAQAVLRGHLTLPNGNPAAGIKLHLSDGLEWQGIRMDDFAATTDADGRYSIDQLPGQPVYLSLLSTADYVISSHTIQLAVGTTTTEDLRLSSGTLVTGSVTNANGKAIPNE